MQDSPGTESSVAAGPSISPTTRRLGPVLPALPPEVGRTGFPLIATLAPVAASLVLWALTRSPFALVFALLGPVIAIASLLDSRVHAGRRQRAHEREFDAGEAAALAAIARFHTGESEVLGARNPCASVIIGGGADRARWAVGVGEPVSVTVGRGAVPSSIETDEDAAGVAAHRRDASARRASLARRAASIPDAPVVVEATGGGVGVCGPISLARAVARSLVIQLAHTLDPGSFRVEWSPADDWCWLETLPQRGEGTDRFARIQSPEGSRVVFVPIDSAGSSGGSSGWAGSDGAGARRDRGGGAGRGVPDSRCAVITIAPHEQQLPRGCATVIRVGQSGAAIVVTESGGPVSVTPEPISLEAATGFAEALRRIWSTENAGAVLPAELMLSELPNPATGGSRTLECALGRSASGDWSIDLAADGPHAVVGGTTGSGKSELLVSWAVALATRYGPKEVNLLFVDFKGGASFEALRFLPHCAGLVTDLDGPGARRALESLAAELRFRERMLAAAAARSIEELMSQELARLVIFVDEFAALRSAFPELHELFADIAARGRSLGVHLILCSQRPASALRDEILANCAIRIALRVIDQADSVAVVGSRAAVQLPRRPPGRMITVIADRAVETVQVALTGDVDIALANAHDPVVLRPIWCEPLPALVSFDDLRRLSAAQNDRAAPDSRPGVNGAFGLLDLPGEQRQECARYDPGASGCLAVIGCAGSGRTSALRAIAATTGETVWVPGEPGAAWEFVVAEAQRTSTGRSGWRLVVVDDLDSLLGRFPPEYQHELLDLLVRIGRDGGSRRTALAISTRTVPAILGALLAVCEERLILRTIHRQDHLAAGGDTPGFDPRLPPGGGHWRGDRVQVGWVPATARLPVQAPPLLELTPGITAIVSTVPDDIRRRVGARATIVDVEAVEPGAAVLSDGERGAGQPVILLGDPQAWHAAWALTAAIRHRYEMVFDRCTLAEFRSITAIRALPPPLMVGRAEGWIVAPGADVRRIRFD